VSWLKEPSSTGLKLFGTSGIRGRLGHEVSEELFYKMGLSLGQYLDNSGVVVIGCDLRPESKLIYPRVLNALRDSGLEVKSAGEVPTPALLHYELQVKADAAIMVTGSHTVPGVTGLLFFKDDGGESDEEMERKLERIYFGSKFTTASNRGSIENVDALFVYQNRLTKLLDRKLEDYKIAFDAGNGSMSGVATRILIDAGASVRPLFDKPDGTFPNRLPYPRKETLKSLSETTKQCKADFGIGTDGDGDRAIFVDDMGRVLMGDISGALFADRELSTHSGSVVAPINSSNLITDVCERHGSRLIITKVGPPAIISSIRKNADVVFGLEETGKYIWPETLLYGDCVYSTFKMCELLASACSSLSCLVDKLPKYRLEKRMLRYRGCSKERILEEIHHRCLREFGHEKVTTLDGVRVEFNDKSWMLLRPSGTEPFVRCYAESTTRKKARELAHLGMRILRESISAAKLFP
jgi:phosphomannomutase